MRLAHDVEEDEGLPGTGKRRRRALHPDVDAAPLALSAQEAVAVIVRHHVGHLLGHGGAPVRPEGSS